MQPTHDPIGARRVTGSPTVRHLARVLAVLGGPALLAGRRAVRLAPGASASRQAWRLRRTRNAPTPPISTSPMRIGRSTSPPEVLPELFGSGDGAAEGVTWGSLGAAVGGAVGLGDSMTSSVGFTVGEAA